MSNPDVLIQLQLPTLAGAPTLPVANRAELRAATLGSLGSFLGAAPDVHIVDTPTANGAAAATIGVWEARPRPLEHRDSLLQPLDFVGARPRDGINVNQSMVVHDATMRRLLSRTVAADVDPAQAHDESTDIEFDDGINTATTVLTVRRIRHFGGEGVKLTSLEGVIARQQHRVHAVRAPATSACRHRPQPDR